MSRENVEVVRRSFEAWERGDLAGVIEMFDEAVVTRPLIGPEWEPEAGRPPEDCSGSLSRCARAGPDV
jgi:ketosteroid isomerase-like protein